MLADYGALGPFARDSDFSPTVETCSLSWQGFESDSGIWREKGTGLGFTETL